MKRALKINAMGVVLIIMVGISPCDAFINIGPALFCESPPNSMTFHWRTNNFSAGTLSLGLDTSYTLLIVTEVLPDTNHFLKITNLHPGWHYYYRIICDADTEYGDFWEPPDHLSQGEISEIVMYGDNQGGINNSQVPTFRRVVNRISCYSPHLILHLGDIIEGGATLPASTLQRDFDEDFFIPAYPINKRAPTIVTPGNHDFGPRVDNLRCTLYPGPNNCQICFSVWRNNVTNPGNRMFFSFDYGPVRFIVLNVNVWPCWCADEPGEFNHGGVNIIKQGMVNFLEAELQAAENCPYVIVVTHIPPFSCGWYSNPPIHYGGSYYSDWMFRSLVQLARNYNISAWFSGHYHYYQRNRDPAGYPITYIESGRTAAGGYYPTYDSTWVVFTDTTLSAGGRCGRFHFVRLLISNTSITGIATDTTGFTFDTFTILPRFPPPDYDLHLVISTSGDAVQLSWHSIPGATYYQIYRSSEPDFPIQPENLITSTSGTSFMNLDVNNAPLHRYFYKVTYSTE